LAHPERILVHLPTWVGDAVMATPALRALRRAHPRASLSVEGRPLLRELLLGIPSFDEFLADPGRGVAAVRGRVQRLRRKGFDWAVILPDSPRAALAPFLARVPRRIGYARDPVRRLLLTLPLEPPRQGGRRLPIPMVERYLHIVRALGCGEAGEQLDLSLDPRHVETLRRRLRTLGASEEQPLLAVTPGASFGSSKLWPPEHFARAADEIARRHALRAVLAPAPSEVELAARIASLMKTEPLLLADPAFTLGELKALIARATLLLTNDTGPRHIAVAFERPVVVVMGPTDPRHTATNLQRQQVLREPIGCSPCHLKRCPIDHRCMRRLAPERVVEAAETLLT
jgi:heptosyltransferase-2